MATVDEMSQLQRWKVAEELYYKSPCLVQREILKHMKVILLNIDMQNKEVIKKIGMEIIRLAKAGQMKPLKTLLHAYNYSPKILNYSNRWDKQKKDRCFYHLSWLCSTDTPLVAALRSGNIDIAKFLLSCGAIRFLPSCDDCEGYDEARRIEMEREKQREEAGELSDDYEALGEPDYWARSKRSGKFLAYDYE